jgi:pimeloyl-ACP methyl ester carboxylesterase
MTRLLILLLIVAIPSLLSAQEKLIKVGQTNYNIFIKGMETRKPGSPVLILESGLGTGLHHWDAILEGLATIAPVFAYDRAGVGKSDKIYEMPTTQFVAEKLNAILKTLNIPPPYVLVGHSLGGVYIRGYAGLYPDNVTGLVFIDPADFTERKEDWKYLLTSVGVSDTRADEMIKERLYTPSTVDSVRYGPWSEIQMLTALRRSDFEELNRLPLPSVPMLFFIGGKFEVPQDRWSKDYDHPKFFQKRTDLNIERWRKFIYSSSKGGNLVYSAKSGHFVHRDDSETVVSNIRLLIESSRK